MKILTIETAKMDKDLCGDMIHYSMPVTISNQDKDETCFVSVTYFLDEEEENIIDENCIDYGIYSNMRDDKIEHEFTEKEIDTLTEAIEKFEKEVSYAMCYFHENLMSQAQ